MQHKLKLAFIMLMFAALASCKKDRQETTKPQDPQLATLSAKIATPSFPAVENGMLVFKDQQQFDNYMNYLDQVTDPKNYDSATLMEQEFDQDAILESIENKLGFTSIRKISHDKFMALNEIGWDRFEDIPEEHFIHDMELKSVLNESLTVKIGTNYVRFINKNLCVKVDATADAKILRAFAKLPVTATLEDALNIDPPRRYSSLLEQSITGNVSIFDKDQLLKPTGAGDLTIINLKHEANNCLNSKFVTFSNTQLYQEFDQNSPTYNGPGATLPATFTIDFGDNSPPLTIHTISQNSSNTSFILPQFTHTYPAAGIYVLKLHAQADWVYGGAYITYANRKVDIKVAATSCSNKAKEGAEEFFPVPDGSRAVSGKISVIYSNNFWTGAYTRTLAETSSWLRNGSKWKKSKSEIWVKSHIDRKDEGCNIIGDADADGWSSSAKHIEEHRTNEPYYWYEVTSQHGIKYHDVWYYHDKVLNACQ